MSTKPPKPPRAPKDLGAAGRALWGSLQAQIGADGLVFDAREVTLLTHACRESDMLANIEAELATVDRLTVKGAQGQQVAHPLIGEARRSRAQVAALLRLLGLEDPSLSVGVGRGARTTSQTARRAVSSRYGANA